MNKKLIFRILGALASALIIVGVFIPFVSVTGYSASLWENFEITNSLYLPIMIIIFGAIGVIFFALNIKTEFAYMSTGAISFFLVMQTIDIINQGTFSTLSIGYYFLVIGAILTGVMAFLTNLGFKENNPKNEESTEQKEKSIMSQIDRLYDNPTNENENVIANIQPIDNIIEPISPVQTTKQVIPVQPIEEVNQVIQNQPIPDVNLNSSIQKPEVQNLPSIDQQTLNSQPVNPVVQEFATPINPVVQEFNQSNGNIQPQINMSQTNQFDSTVISTASDVISPIQNVQPLEQKSIDPMASTNEFVGNPVIQEFEQIDKQQPFIVHPTENNVVQPNQTTINETSNLDIFGQPINK